MASQSPQSRRTSLDMSPEDFRRIGHDLIDSIADYFDSLPSGRITRGSSPTEVRTALGDGPFPEKGTDPAAIFAGVRPILLEHSLFTAHPRFWGYITGSPAPAGVLADILASAINPNVGAWQLSPVASEIELQAVRWLAEMVGFPSTSGGVLVSGGNMANFVCFLAARAAKASWDLRADGMKSGEKQMTVYASKETHTWIHKAADLFGLGVNAIRWIPVDDDQRMILTALREAIAADRKAGHQPFMVVGAGGTVSTGAVDPLHELAALAKAEDLWFHVDGAYGAPAVVSAKAPKDLLGLAKADSVALDPHKWLYVPLEAGCSLVRDPKHLIAAFSYRPDYYRFEGPDGEVRTNMFEYGMQNSRGFRALKVWVQLRQAGKEGMRNAIDEDIALSELMADVLRQEADIEVWTQNLSITTFRYVPPDLRADAASRQEYLNALNEAILKRLQNEGHVFVSNAVIRGTFVLRACIVNFRTTAADVRMLPKAVLDVALETDRSMRKG